ncbi:MAG TPA: DUF6056 family protein [Puia sp.]|nr:DUF6056 family protein [Puia sp.]
MLNRILLIAGIYVLLPFLYIARFNHPCADDYAYGQEFPKHSFTDVVKQEYFKWSGRYFSRVIYKFNPTGYHSLKDYRLFSVLLILLFAAVIILLLRNLTREYLSFGQSLGLSALLLFLYFAKVPSTAEAFYWFSSASIYQLANILEMLLLTALVRLTTPGSRRPLYLILCSLLCILIIGCNEISLIITFLFIHFIAASQYLRNKTLNPWLLSLCIVCVIFAIVEIAAPGNFRRLNATQHFSRSIIWTITGSLSITSVYVSQWIGPALAASVLYIPLFGMPIAQKMRETNRSFTLSLKGFLWFYIGTFCFLQVFIIWVAGGSNLGRIFDVIYLFFLLGWFFILQQIINKNLHRLQPLARYSPAFAILGLLLFLSSLFDINNNISTAYVDIIAGKAKQYDVELINREQKIKECQSDTCYVRALSDIPSTLFFTDIRPLSDPTGLWINKCYSTYFNAGFIVPDNPPPIAKPNIESLRTLGKTMRARLIPPPASQR